MQVAVKIAVLVSLASHAVAFGGSGAGDAATPALMSLSSVNTMASGDEPTLGSTPDVGLTSATPSGCGKHLDCWECEYSGSCNWYSNGCSTKSMTSNPNKCYNVDPVQLPPCSSHSSCSNCTYQQGCIWYNNQCKYSESGSCQGDPTCANTQSQCDSCSSIQDCGGCANDPKCAWSTNEGRCKSEGTCNYGENCVYASSTCPWSYCDNYTSAGCRACTEVAGCIMNQDRCVQASKPCQYGCQNTPAECPSRCDGHYDCDSCTGSGNACAWQLNECKEACDYSTAYCATTISQCAAVNPPPVNSCSQNYNCQACTRATGKDGNQCRWQSGVCNDYCNPYTGTDCISNDYQC